MATINPYLNFPGTTEEAFIFYKSVFGGEFLAVMRFRDTADGEKVPEAEKDKLMHIALPIGDTIVMATDALESMGQKLTPGNNLSLSYNADSRADADKIFAGLSMGAKITLPMQDMFWGDYFGMLTDQYGIQWMVAFDSKKA